jgi:hypothetical protein
LVEHLIRNQKVAGSTPAFGSTPQASHFLLIPWNPEFLCAGKQSCFAQKAESG